MAFQTRGRDPLLDSNMAEAIEKRGKELIGFALLLAGMAAAVMIWSYSPADPWWMSATDAPVQNWFGRFGASVAAPMFMIVGWGSWGVAIVLMAWGVRFLLHRGNDRAISRLIFAPIWVALLSIYAATLVPGPEWTHSFGLGGLFGKTALGSLINILPISATVGLKLLSLALGVAMVALGAFVLGFTKVELHQIGRFLLIGLILLYATLMSLLGRTARGAVSTAQTLQAKTAERRERRAIAAAEAAEWAATQDAEAAVIAPSPNASMAGDPTDPTTAYEAEKPGLLSRATNLIRRPEPMVEPEPELVEPAMQYEHEPEAPSDAHIRRESPMSSSPGCVRTPRCRPAPGQL